MALGREDRAAVPPRAQATGQQGSAARRRARASTPSSSSSQQPQQPQQQQRRTAGARTNNTARSPTNREVIANNNAMVAELLARAEDQDRDFARLRANVGSMATTHRAVYNDTVDGCVEDQAALRKEVAVLRKEIAFLRCLLAIVSFVAIAALCLSAVAVKGVPSG